MARYVADLGAVRIVVPVGTEIEQGRLYYIEGFFGIAVRAADGTVSLNGVPGEYETDQIDTSKSFNRGDKVYWDDSAGQLTTTATGNKLVGKVTEPKENDSIWFIMFPQMS